MTWFDSHCHLQDQYRPDEVSEADALAAAAAAGVGGLVCVGTDAASSAAALALVRRARAGDLPAGAAWPALWATVGLHPHDASGGLAPVRRLLEETLASDPSLVAAVGECGLDYHYDHSPRDVQRAVFEEQIALARQLDLTLVVHTREAWDDTLAMLSGERPERVVMHCFTGGPDEARRCLDIGAFLSFSGIVTFSSAQDVRDAARVCPTDRLLVETDAPFLAPVPHRGKPNTPALVPVVGEAVAAVKGISGPEMAEFSTASARRAFALN